MTGKFRYACNNNNRRYNDQRQSPKTDTATDNEEMKYE